MRAFSPPWIRDRHECDDSNLREPVGTLHLLVCSGQSSCVCMVVPSLVLVHFEGWGKAAKCGWPEARGFPQA